MEMQSKYKRLCNGFPFFLHNFTHQNRLINYFPQPNNSLKNWAFVIKLEGRLLIICELFACVGRPCYALLDLGHILLGPYWRKY